MLKISKIFGLSQISYGIENAFNRRQLYGIVHSQTLYQICVVRLVPVRHILNLNCDFQGQD